MNAEINELGNEGADLAGEPSEQAAEAADLVSGLVGRELDAAIAERVMGEPMPPTLEGVTADRAFNLYLVGEPIKSRLNAWRCHWIYDHGDVPEWHPRPYSTDITAAMEVIEKTRQGGWEIQITSDDESPTWSAVFDSRGAAGKLLLGENESDSLPEAVCRAALQAYASASAFAQQDASERLLSA